MKNIDNIDKSLLITLVVILVLVGSSSSYFYSKYNKRKKEVEIKVNNKDKIDKAFEESKEVTLNGNKHTIKLKYHYVENIDATEEEGKDCEYFKFRVGVNMFFDDINITEISKHNKNQTLYFDGNNKATLEDVQKHVRNNSLMQNIDIKTIKGKDKKEYLFVSMEARLGQSPASPNFQLPIILNEKGEIVFDLINVSSFEHSYYLVNEDLADIYFSPDGDYKGYYFNEEKGYTEINYLAVKKYAESSNKELINYSAYQINLIINNNEAIIEEQRLGSYHVQWNTSWY